VKANKKTKIATMIVNATRSRTPSPLSKLAVASFYTNPDEPFVSAAYDVQCSNV